MAASESIFLKRTLDRPLKGSLHRQALGPATAIVESRNGPKNQSIRGAKWLPLGTSLPSFFVRRKKVADRPDFCCGMSAHKERNPTQKSYRLRGHFLLSEFQLVATKGSKNAAGSFAPGLPENVPIFSS